MATVFSHPKAGHLSALFMERGEINFVEAGDEHPEGMDLQAGYSEFAGRSHNLHFIETQKEWKM